MRRLILAATIAAALLLPASVGTVVVSTPAWASASVTCNTLYGYADSSYKFTLRKCTPRTAEKSLSGFGTVLTRVGGPNTYTWKWNGGATTIVSLSVVQTGTCPAGYTAYTDTGTVSGGTSTYTQTGDSIQLNLCKRRAPKYMDAVRLAPGSMASL
jgi:hypothetical protein